jgi:hypothetical protein
MELLSDYLINNKTYIQIYSIDGIYQIHNSIINKLITIDNDIKIIKNYYKDFHLIVDSSYYNLVKETKIEPNHISSKIKSFFYKTNKDSNIYFIIECEIIDDNIIPFDIYFELSNNVDINDNLVKKEIIVFLSLLI